LILRSEAKNEYEHEKEGEYMDTLGIITIDVIFVCTVVYLVNFHVRMEYRANPSLFFALGFSVATFLTFN
jgi:hypothetical protein